MSKADLTALADETRARANDSWICKMMADLNRTIHEPARLAILTILSASRSADFTFLKTATGLSSGNLSVQLSRLEDASLITIERTIEKKRTLTIVALSETGRTQLNHYWGQMERIREHSQRSAISAVDQAAPEVRKTAERRPAQAILAQGGAT